MEKPNLVVISYWSGRSIRPLKKLIYQINVIDSGAIFDSLIVCNGSSEQVENFINKSNLSHKFQVVKRPNFGFNIGAWDYGWKYLSNYRNFLFIQDDCIIIRENWLKAFVDKFNHDHQIGLLGERINWRNSWDDLAQSNSNSYHKKHTLNGQKMPRIDLYRAYLSKNSIPEGVTAEHIQSLILFTSKQVLEQIRGFPLGESYGEAIASEIAISKKVQAAGYNIAMVNPDKCFYYISHPQWLERKGKVKRLLHWLQSIGL